MELTSKGYKLTPEEEKQGFIYTGSPFVIQKGWKKEGKRFGSFGNIACAICLKEAKDVFIADADLYLVRNMGVCKSCNDLEKQAAGIADKIWWDLNEQPEDQYGRRFWWSDHLMGEGGMYRLRGLIFNYLFTGKMQANLQKFLKKNNIQLK